MTGERFDSIVVGGGFFGASLALNLRKHHAKVALIEKEPQLLKRASLINQARIHGGYHYPRSVVTGLRSRENFTLFTDSYSDCIVKSFRKYYAISRYSSSVTSQQFKLFCERIGAPLMPASALVVSQFNPDLIEAVFEVEEFAFDAHTLRDLLHADLERSGVSVFFNTTADSVEERPDSELQVRTLSGGSESVVVGHELYLCLYGATNRFLYNSKLPQIPVRQEYAEMCLVKPTGFLENSGVTVMCGPFFSIMPYPSKGVHSLSHVRYTPHFSWHESDEEGEPKRLYDVLDPPRSKFLHMKKDAARYLPVVNDLEYEESIWESKTLLPRNEIDDARPILLKRGHGLKNITCIIGAKIDNVFDVNQALALS